MVVCKPRARSASRDRDFIFTSPQWGEGEHDARGSAPLRNVIKRIRHLESAFGVVAPFGGVALEIAFLIADIGDDGVAEAAFDIAARGGFVSRDRWLAERARVA